MSARPDTPLVSSWVASPNHEPRRNARAVDLILLHYTACPSAADALTILTDPASKVSSHYLIDEDGAVTQMVAESQRAWHAGLAHWAGESDINSCSIGIEIQNEGPGCAVPHFPEAQMQAVIALCADIVARHRVPADRVLAHSDVAPARKQDPGEHFDWARLHAAGIGLWTNPEPVSDRGDILAPGHEGEAVEELHRDLKTLGYGLNAYASYTQETETVVRAFQRHWRAARVDGLADYSTRTTLKAILTKKKKLTKE